MLGGSALGAAGGSGQWAGVGRGGQGQAERSAAGGSARCRLPGETPAGILHPRPATSPHRGLCWELGWGRGGRSSSREGGLLGLPGKISWWIN